MRKLLIALFIGLAALSAAACGNSGTTTAPGNSIESLSPIESPSDSTESMSPSESMDASPASS